MKSSISHAIKKRDKPNDVFITPLPLAKFHIDMIETIETDTWYDPFKNDALATLPPLLKGSLQKQPRDDLITQHLLFVFALSERRGR